MEDGTATQQRSIHLETTVYLPAGKGPHPVVMFHHGSTGPRLRLPTATERPDEWGQHLADRGIAVIAPMRRGRGRSGGTYFETYFGDVEASERGITYALQSTYACEDYLRQQSWVDQRQLILAGASRGGMLAAWHAATRPGCCAGVVGFAPGWTSSRGAGLEQPDVNLQLLNRIAGPIEVPILMLYANEDSLYPRARSEQYVESLRRMAPTLEAQWLAAPSGHRFFAQSMPLWAERVDAFLGACLAPARE